MTATPDATDLVEQTVTSPEPRDLGRRAVAGVLITAAFAVAWELLRAGSGLLSARFLQPRDFALFGVATTALTFGGAAVAFNIDRRLVQAYEDPAEVYDSGFSLQVGLMLVYLVFAAIAGPVIARLYGDAVLIPVCLALGFQGAIGVFGLPIIHMQRRLQWWRQRLIASLGPAVTSIFTIGLAVQGRGVWALVLGQLAGSVVTSAVVWFMAPRRPRLRLRIPRRHLRFFFDFAWPLWLGGIVSMLAINGMLFEIQALVGIAILGYIRLAVGLGDRIDRAEQVLGSVLFPVLSRTRDPARLRRAWVLGSQVVLLWSIPTGLGLAVFSRDIIHFVLGDRWLPVLPMLVVEGVGEVFNAIATMWQMFYVVQGRTRPTLALGLQVNLGLLVLVGVLARLYGYPGIVAALAVVVVFSLVQRRRYIRRLLPGVPVLQPAVRLLLAGAVAAAATLGLGMLLMRPGSPAALALRLACFGAVYAGMVAALERPFLAEALLLLRRREVPA